MRAYEFEMIGMCMFCVCYEMYESVMCANFEFVNVNEKKKKKKKFV
jgi:hypothetical protein